MSQPIVINIGAIPNDGTGDPLRTAFNDVNLNFANVFAYGPVLSNIQIANNTILTTNTNGNLILNPNGIGQVQANAHVVPDQTRIRNLGAPSLYWDTAYVWYGNFQNATIGTANIGNIGTLTMDVGNLHLLGGTNGYVLQTDGTGNLTWTAQTGGTGNGTPAGANTQVQYNDAGSFGATAGFTFDNTSNVLTVPGNIQMNNTSGIYSSTSGYVVGLQMSNTEPSVKLVANNHEWMFDSNGVLKFPAGYSTTYPAITMGEPGNLLIQGYLNPNFSEDGGNVIVSGGFGDGNNGNATVLGQQVTVKAQLSATNGSPTYSWTFGENGNLTLPAGSTINNANGEVGITTQNPNISVNAILNGSYGLSAGTYINQPTTALTGTGTGMTVNYTVLTGNDVVDSVSIYTPGLGYATGDQITIPVGIPVSGAIFDITVGAPSTETWIFGQTGELTTPQGGRLGSAGKGWQGLDGGYGNPVSFTSFYANGFYAGCLTASPDGNLTISTYTGNGQQGLWTFDNTGNLTTSGNISAIGNITVGNIVADSNNVLSIGSNGNIWIFNSNTGNLTIPSNGAIRTQTGTNGNIYLHPDGSGTVVIQGASTGPLLLLRSDTANTINRVEIDTIGSSNSLGGIFVGRFSRGTIGVPAAVQAGDQLVALKGKGYTGAEFSSPVGYISINAYDNWTPGNVPSQLNFYTTGYNNTTPVLNMQIAPNGNVEIFNGNIVSQGGYISGNTVTGGDAFYAGVPGFTPLVSNVIAQFAGDVDSYAQINFQNINSGSAATTEIVVTANNGDNATYFGDFGIAGSNYVSSPNDLGTAVYSNDTYVYSQGSGTGQSGNLVLGSNEQNGVVRIIANGSNIENVVATFSSAGVSVAGNITANSISLVNGYIQSGVTTVVNDGINSISRGTTTVMDVFGFPFTTITRGQVTISGITTTTQANGTWYYQSINTNTFSLYTDSTYTTPVDSTTWSPYIFQNGLAAFVENLPAGNIVLNANGFLSTFSNNGQVSLPGDFGTDGNITGNYFIGNGSQLTGIVSSYGNANVVANLVALGSNPVSTTGNITGGNLITAGIANVATLAVTGSATVQGSISIFSSSTSLSATGNVIGGNVKTVGLISATGNVTGNYFIGNGSQLTGIVSSYGNANVVANLVALGSNPVSTTGNISGNYFIGNGSQLTGISTQTTGSWTLAAGTNTVSLTVPGPGTYSIWVNGNIPNGIVTYTATVVVTNNNVPVVGSSYGWYYAAGNALVLTAIPTQIVGTVNNISNAVVATTTANVFEFGITNNSGNSAVVNYGYTKF